MSNEVMMMIVGAWTLGLRLDLYRRVPRGPQRPGVTGVGRYSSGLLMNIHGCHRLVNERWAVMQRPKGSGSGMELQFNYRSFVDRTRVIVICDLIGLICTTCGYVQGCGEPKTNGGRVGYFY